MSDNQPDPSDEIVNKISAEITKKFFAKDNENEFIINSTETDKLIKLNNNSSIETTKLYNSLINQAKNIIKINKDSQESYQTELINRAKYFNHVMSYDFEKHASVSYDFLKTVTILYQIKQLQDDDGENATVLEDLVKRMYNAKVFEIPSDLVQRAKVLAPLYMKPLDGIRFEIKDDSDVDALEQLTKKGNEKLEEFKDNLDNLSVRWFPLRTKLFQEYNNYNDTDKFLKKVDDFKTQRDYEEDKKKETVMDLTTLMSTIPKEVRKILFVDRLNAVLESYRVPIRYALTNDIVDEPAKEEVKTPIAGGRLLAVPINFKSTPPQSAPETSDASPITYETLRAFLQNLKTELKERDQKEAVENILNNLEQIETMQFNGASVSAHMALALMNTRKNLEQFVKSLEQTKSLANKQTQIALLTALSNVMDSESLQNLKTAIEQDGELARESTRIALYSALSNVMSQDDLETLKASIETSVQDTEIAASIALQSALTAALSSAKSKEAIEKIEAALTELKSQEAEIEDLKASAQDGITQAIADAKVDIANQTATFADEAQKQSAQIANTEKTLTESVAAQNDAIASLDIAKKDLIDTVSDSLSNNTKYSLASILATLSTVLEQDKLQELQDNLAASEKELNDKITDGITQIKTDNEETIKTIIDRITQKEAIMTTQITDIQQKNQKIDDSLKQSHEVADKLTESIDKFVKFLSPPSASSGGANSAPTPDPAPAPTPTPEPKKKEPDTDEETSKEAVKTLGDLKKETRAISDALSNLHKKYEKYVNKFKEDKAELIRIQNTQAQSGGADPDKSKPQDTYKIASKEKQRQFTGFFKIYNEEIKADVESIVKSIKDQKEALKSVHDRLKSSLDSAKNNIIIKNILGTADKLVEGSFAKDSPDRGYLSRMNALSDALFNEFSEMLQAFKKESAGFQGLSEKKDKDKDKNGKGPNKQMLDAFFNLARGQSGGGSDSLQALANDIENEYLQGVIIRANDVMKRILDPAFNASTAASDPSLFSQIYNKFLERTDEDSNPHRATLELAQTMHDNNLVPREVLKITFIDKAVFLFFTLFLRLISLSIAEFFIDRGYLKTMTTALTTFLAVYVIFFIIFTVLVNLDSYRMRIVFNYLNFHANSGHVFMHIGSLIAFSALIYIIMWNVNTSLGDIRIKAISDEEKVNMMYRLEILTMIVWIFIAFLVIVM